MQNPPKILFYIITIVSWFVSLLFFIFYASNSLGLGNDPNTTTPSVALVVFSFTWFIGLISLVLLLLFHYDQIGMYASSTYIPQYRQYLKDKESK